MSGAVRLVQLYLLLDSRHVRSKKTWEHHVVSPIKLFLLHCSFMLLAPFDVYPVYLVIICLHVIKYMISTL